MTYRCTNAGSRPGMHDEIFHFEIFKNFKEILKYFKTPFLKYFMKFLIFIIKWLTWFTYFVAVNYTACTHSPTWNFWNISRNISWNTTQTFASRDFSLSANCRYWSWFVVCPTQSCIALDRISVHFSVSVRCPSVRPVTTDGLWAHAVYLSSPNLEHSFPLTYRRKYFPRNERGQGHVTKFVILQLFLQPEMVEHSNFTQSLVLLPLLSLSFL